MRDRRSGRCFWPGLDCVTLCGADPETPEKRVAIVATRFFVGLLFRQCRFVFAAVGKAGTEFFDVSDDFIQVIGQYE